MSESRKGIASRLSKSDAQVLRQGQELHADSRRDLLQYMRDNSSFGLAYSSDNLRSHLQRLGLDRRRSGGNASATACTPAPRRRSSTGTGRLSLTRSSSRLSSSSSAPTHSRGSRQARAAAEKESALGTLDVSPVQFIPPTPQLRQLTQHRGMAQVTPRMGGAQGLKQPPSARNTSPLYMPPPPSARPSSVARGRRPPHSCSSSARSRKKQRRVSSSGEPQQDAVASEAPSLLGLALPASGGVRRQSASPASELERSISTAETENITRTQQRRGQRTQRTQPHAAAAATTTPGHWARDDCTSSRQPSLSMLSTEGSWTQRRGACSSGGSSVPRSTQRQRRSRRSGRLGELLPHSTDDERNADLVEEDGDAPSDYRVGASQRSASPSSTSTSATDLNASGTSDSSGNGWNNREDVASVTGGASYRRGTESSAAVLSQGGGREPTARWCVGDAHAPTSRTDALRWCVSQLRQKASNAHLPPLPTRFPSNEAAAAFAAAAKQGAEATPSADVDSADSLHHSPTLTEPMNPAFASARADFARAMAQCEGALYGLGEQYRELHGLLTASVENGENSSVILVGGRGSGKSFVLRQVLRSLSEGGVADTGSAASAAPSSCGSSRRNPRFLQVRLNGLVHTDDHSALKEITRQLSLEGAWNEHLDANSEEDAEGADVDAADADMVDLEDEEDQRRGGGPDTTAVARQRSKSREQQQKQRQRESALLSDAAPGRAKGGFSQHLRFLLDVLREGSFAGDDDGVSNEGRRAVGTPVIFVLDEFEAFARRHKQTLLYNLLDLTQSKQSSMVVVGLTTRLDVVEQLEKRVTSRFDNRQLLFPSPSFQELRAILLQRLLLRLPERWTKQRQGHLTRTPAEQRPYTPPCMIERLVHEWNAAATNLVMSHSECDKNLRRKHSLGCSVGWFLRMLELAASKLAWQGRLRSEFIRWSDLKFAISKLTVDVRIQLMRSVSTTELVLVIAMVHLEQRDHRVYNFETVHHELRSLPENSALHTDRIPKAVYSKAFEHLIDLKLVAYARASFSGGTTGGGVVPRDYRTVRLMLPASEVMELLRAGSGAGSGMQCTTDVLYWARGQL